MYNCRVTPSSAGDPELLGNNRAIMRKGMKKFQIFEFQELKSIYLHEGVDIDGQDKNAD